MPRDDCSAYILARGGSKGIKDKNLQKVGGKSLLRRAIESCLASQSISDVWVSSDSKLILTEAKNCGAQTISRPETLAGDSTTSEEALEHLMLEVRRLNHLKSVAVLVQATSPFIDPADLDVAVKRVSELAEADSIFAGVAEHIFQWQPNASGSLDPVNHDSKIRLPRQELPEVWRETGAFYVFHAENFLMEGTRFHGRVQVQQTDPLFSIDIDSPRDLELARLLQNFYSLETT